VFWKSKNQVVVVRLSAESEYRAMTDLTCELMWIQDILIKMDFVPKTPMRLYCDNRLVNYIVQNHVFHAKTKHTEVDCHVVWRKYNADIIESKHVSSVNQLVNLLTKPLRRSPI